MNYVDIIIVNYSFLDYLVRIKDISVTFDSSNINKNIVINICQ